MKPRIYHNPRCSKSRATMTLLENEGIDVEIIEYLQTPPTAETLAALLQKLGIAASALIRSGETEFKETGLNPETASEDELIALMAQVPKLIERPIVEVADAARIGRPPEQVLELFP